MELSILMRVEEAELRKVLDEQQLMTTTVVNLR